MAILKDAYELDLDDLDLMQCLDMEDQRPIYPQGGIYKDKDCEAAALDNNEYEGDAAKAA